MTRGAYYNDNGRVAAAWLRELIAAGELPPGDVDERSIKDVRADDLRGYVQCHFFAGIGIWPAALRRGGWPDERPVGTASCPCQPFSAAGDGGGFDDPRHLWPYLVPIIDGALQQGQPWADTLFGEQVATAGHWLDLVSADLEARGYAIGSPDLPAAGFAQGAHIRQRFYWLADRHNAERWADLADWNIGDWPATGRIEGYGEPRAGGATGGLGDSSSSSRTRRHAGAVLGAEARGDRTGLEPRRLGDGAVIAGAADGLGHHHHHQGPPQRPLTPDERGALRLEGPAVGATGSLRGCDWLLCHDARIRPVEAGTFPLAASDPARMGLLGGYGNSLDFETAVNFVGAYMEAELLA